MNNQLSQMVPDPWQSLFHFLTIPLSWIPEMQRSLMEFVLSSATGWLAGLYYVLLLFPVLLWIGAVWCTHLTVYTLPFRSGRIECCSRCAGGRLLHPSDRIHEGV